MQRRNGNESISQSSFSVQTDSSPGLNLPRYIDIALRLMARAESEYPVRLHMHNDAGNILQLFIQARDDIFGGRVAFIIRLQHHGNMPLLGVAFTVPTPRNDATAVTSGSF